MSGVGMVKSHGHVTPILRVGKSTPPFVFIVLIMAVDFFLALDQIARVMIDFPN